jgi:hypothetical protein
MEHTLTRLSGLGAAILVLLGAFGSVVLAEDPPPSDPPIYEECSATSASKEGDDKYEFDNCAGSCPEGQGPCAAQDFEIGGVDLIGCGCNLNSDRRSSAVSCSSARMELWCTHGESVPLAG